MEYLRKLILNGNESIANLHGMSTQDLKLLINHRTNQYNVENQNEQQTNQLHHILNRVVISNDARQSIFSENMFLLGFNGSEEINWRQLSCPENIDITNELLQRIKNIINNSGLSDRDVCLISDQLKSFLLNEMIIDDE